MILTHHIWAVGRNYIDHAAEMKALAPTSPLIFLKAGSCLNNSSKIQLPSWTQDIHHEIEIAYLIDENLCLSHITLALDLTARDAQSLAKQKGEPWTKAKSFKGSAPIGPWISLSEFDASEDLTFELQVNGILKQKGLISEMIFKPQFILNELKKIYPVIPHDVILTGTPAGVAAIKSGDLLEGKLYASANAQQTLLACQWDVE